MQCPYCQSSLKEAELECPSCGIDGEKLTRIMGPMPVIFGGVSQSGSKLSAREVKKLTKVIQKFQRLFPQSRLHLLVRSFPQEMEFKVILFWVFNQAGLSSQGSKGGQNRDVVLMIDPSRSKAGLIVGYGLEPLLSQESLDGVVSSGQGALGNGEFAVAFEAMVTVLTERMREASQGLPEAVGLLAKAAADAGEDY